VGAGGDADPPPRGLPLLRVPGLADVAAQKGERVVTRSAWIMMLSVCGVITYFAVKFFVMALKKPTKGE